MADAQRLDELRRRVQKDPASLAFAQLAEEYRRAGRHDEAIRTCRDGLTHHPTYLSARVTLGRALLALGDIDTAEHELQAALDAAPENLAALRGLAEIHQLRGRSTDALAHLRAAQALAPDDLEIARAIGALERSAWDDAGARSSAAPAPAAVHQEPPSAAGIQESPSPAATSTLAALERWLAAIRADRAVRSDADD